MTKNKSVSLPKAAKKIKKKSNLKTTTSSGSSVPAIKKKKKGVLKKVVSKINKINPATILLRNGVLASMKLNIKNVAGRLRWSYLTPEQATAKGIIPEKFQKLIVTRQKLENIFTVAGGKVDNLRKAILGGKGNKDKSVNGLGMLPMIEWSGYMNETTPLDQLLGPEAYYSENIEDMESCLPDRQGFGQLGEPITLTSIAAAAGVIAGIVGALKQVGDIFGGKGKDSEDFDESKTDAPENNVNTSTNNSSTQIPDTANNSSSQSIDEGNSQEINNSDAIVKTSSSTSSNDANETDETGVTAIKNNPVSTTNDDSKDNTGNTAPDDKQGFWDKNKTWIKPVAIGVGGLTLIAVGFHLMKGKTQNKSSPSHSLSGVPYKKKKKKKNHHRSHKTKHHYKKAVALL